MTIDFSLSLENLLAAGYLFCYIVINFTAYLIATFYRKKFSHSLMNTGFVASIVFSFLAIPTLFLLKSQFATTVKFILILASAILSSWNSIILYVTMRKVRK